MQGWLSKLRDNTLPRRPGYYLRREEFWSKERDEQDISLDIVQEVSSLKTKSILKGVLDVVKCL